MAIRTYKVTLDTKNTIAPEPVYLRQGDRTGAVVIDATLMDNGSPVMISGFTLSFMANTADGQALIADTNGFNIVNAAGGEFTYRVPSQLGSVPGKIKIAYFSLTDSSGAQSTFNVAFVVEQAADMTQRKAEDWVSNLNNIKDVIKSIDPSGKLLQEVIDARGNFAQLGDRENAQDSAIASKPSMSSVTDLLRGILPGSPKGVYPSAVDVKTKGNQDGSVYIAADTGHWWYFNGVWTDGGVYQSPINLNQMGTINVDHRTPIVVTQSKDDKETHWYMKIPVAFITSADGSYRILLDPNKPVSSDGNNGWDITHIAGLGGYICWDKVNNRINSYQTSEPFTKNDIVIGFAWYDGDFSFLGSANITFDGHYQFKFYPDMAMFYSNVADQAKLNITQDTWTLHMPYGFYVTAQTNAQLEATDIDATAVKDHGGYIIINRDQTISVVKPEQVIPPYSAVVGIIWFDGTLYLNLGENPKHAGYGFVSGTPDASIQFLTAPATFNILMKVSGSITVQTAEGIFSPNLPNNGVDLTVIAKSGGVIVYNSVTNSITGRASLGKVVAGDTIIGFVTMNGAKIFGNMPYQWINEFVGNDSPFVGIKILVTGDSVTQGLVDYKPTITNKPYSYWLQKELHAAVTNVGDMGKWLSKDSPGSLLPVLKANDLSKYNIITIAYGINDWNDGLNLADVTARLQESIDYIHSANPSAYIVGITPSPVWTHTGTPVDLSTKNSAGDNQNDFIQSLVDVYEKNQIPVFDLRKAPVVTKDGWKTQSIDGIHPNEDSHRRLGNRLAAFLKMNV